MTLTSSSCFDTSKPTHYRLGWSPTQPINPHSDSETNVKNELTPINRETESLYGHAQRVARALGLGEFVTLQAARSEPTTEVSDR